MGWYSFKIDFSVGVLDQFSFILDPAVALHILDIIRILFNKRKWLDSKTTRIWIIL